MRSFLIIGSFLIVSNWLMGQTFIPSNLKTFIAELETESDSIPAERRAELQNLAQQLNEVGSDADTLKIVFICTHNSRRSQLGEIWLQTAAIYYGLPNLRTYSGGTEATAFNHRMVDALVRAGFPIERGAEESNPKYTCFGDPTHVYFSKKYDHPYNPPKEFVAVMVCSQADEACPLVKGATVRMALPYQDPKEFDGTAHEKQAYDHKVRELGREWIYLASLLQPTRD